MPDATDMELVRDYADRNSEAAFATLVQRHINLVYSAAWRVTGNSEDAQDVTQAVFIILAKKAGSLRQRKTLGGWLYETTRFVSVRLLRQRTRQHIREQEASMQTTSNTADTDGVWRQVAPLLEEGMARLDEKDRALLVLRYFENKSGAETATLLGIQEWAAHKRTARALEKLRKFFAHRGIDSTTAAIVGAISANSVQAAPMGLSITTTGVALAGGAAAGGATSTLAKGALKVMAWSTAKTAIVSAVVIGLAVLLVNEHQDQADLRGQNESLRQQLARLQAAKEEFSRTNARITYLPVIQTREVISTVDPLKATNLLERIKDKKPPTVEQLEPYLKANKRSAASLLAAFRTSGDKTLLREAMAKYPNDPEVAFEASVNKDLSPAEQRQWLDGFEQSAPDNALANYLSAANYFNSGQTNQALQELAAASGKQFDDYTALRTEDDTEAYLAAGYSLPEAEATASMDILLPQLTQVKQAALSAVNLANGYLQSGDTDSAQAALEMAVNVGQQYANPSASTEISDLVGMAIEKTALSAMDPNAPYGDTGLTVQDELDQLAQEKAALSALNQQANPLMSQLTDQDWIIYTDRRQTFGEENALQWVVNQYGRQQQ